MILSGNALGGRPSDAQRNSICYSELAHTHQALALPGLFVFLAASCRGLPLNKSPHQSPHVVMTPHHIRWYPVAEESAEGKGMNDTHPSTEIQDEPALYEIRLKGHLADRWAGWFGDVAIGLEDDGTTRLTCRVIDQAALYGLLKKVRSLGMPLLSVNRVESDKTAGGEGCLQ